MLFIPSLVLTVMLDMTFQRRDGAADGMCLGEIARTGHRTYCQVTYVRRYLMQEINS